MQISKKLYTTIIITILTLSTIMAAIPMASAEIITNPNLYEANTTTPISSGPVGTKVDVVGVTGTGNASPFSTVSVYMDSLGGAVLGTGNANIAGNYSIEVTIPPSTAGLHYIVVNDGETESGGAAFTVTPIISLSAAIGLPGDSITVTGHGYASADSIVLTLNSTTLTTPYSTTITTSPTTNGTGSFSVVIAIPAIAMANFDVYNLNGTDEASNMAFTPLDIDYYITLTPTGGPTGITTTIAGRIKASVAYTITFNTAQIATGTTGVDGSYSVAYTIPGVLSPASYPVVITWETTNTRSTTFTVTVAPTISLGASTGVAGLVVTISGSDFSSEATITLYFGTTVVNSTALDSRFGKTSSGGSISEDFTVPTLAPGIYAVSVVDQYGAASASGVFFTILPTPATTIAIRGTSYYPGDLFSFNIYTTETSLGTITVTVRDPSGVTWWTTAAWTLTGTTTKRVLYQTQVDVNANPLALPADAPLGTWNWTITYTPTSTATLTTATGLFAVIELPTMQAVLDNLVTMEASIKGAVTTSEGKIIAVINTKSGQIMTDITALDPQIIALTDAVVVIATMLGEVQIDIAALDLAALDALGVSITAIKGDVATIKTTFGTVTTAVSNLDAKVTSIIGDAATVATIIGTLQGTITAIDGKVATIDTNVGTLQADISDVSAKVDTTPAWIAVVLALVAAVAAIFAVITIRQKIAG